MRGSRHLRTSLRYQRSLNQRSQRLRLFCHARPRSIPQMRASDNSARWSSSWLGRSLQNLRNLLRTKQTFGEKSGVVWVVLLVSFLFHLFFFFQLWIFFFFPSTTPPKTSANIYHVFRKLKDLESTCRTIPEGANVQAAEKKMTTCVNYSKKVRNMYNMH